MIHYELMQSEGVLIVTPEASLEASDFQRLSEELDPYVEARGKLHGLMIDAESFPGWQNFDGLIAHLNFVESHHRKIERVAVVSDDSFLSAAPRFAAHFVQAEIKQFAHAERADALLWLTTAQTGAEGVCLNTAPATLRPSTSRLGEEQLQAKGTHLMNRSNDVTNIPTVDRGQSLSAPTGKVIGFVDSKLNYGAFTDALATAGYPPATITSLYSEDGIHLLERLKDDRFFFADSEDSIIKLSIKELTLGHYAVAIEVSDREHAADIANLAKAHGGHGFTYFGMWVSEQLSA